MHRFKCYYGWWVLGALFFITAYISGIVSFGFTSVFKPVADEFNWSYASVSVAASIRGLEIGLLAPIVGIMLDRVGPRKLSIIGALITGSGLTILSRINSLAAWILFAAANLIGMLSVLSAPNIKELPYQGSPNRLPQKHTNQ